MAHEKSLFFFIPYKMKYERPFHKEVSYITILDLYSIQLKNHKLQVRSYCKNQ